MFHTNLLKLSAFLCFFLTFCCSLFGQLSDASFQLAGNQVSFDEALQIINFSHSELSNTVFSVEDDNGTAHYYSIKENSLLAKNNSLSFESIHAYDLSDIQGLGFNGKLTLGPGVIIVTAESAHGLIYKDNLFFTNSAILAHHDCKIDPHFNSNYNPQQKSATALNYGGTLTTYDVVIAVTGEYYQANGNSTGVVNALVANTVDAWNMIYKPELSIAFNLVEVIEFTDPSTDPFTGDAGGADNRTVQAAEVIDANVTVATYDIGHVFHNTSINTTDWSDGGIASIGAACNAASVPESGTGPQKAAGWSGAQENASNSWIQLSAHEIGHMLGATHTFNGIGNSCDQYSIDENTAYEIGSGTTLMAYNGICDPSQNIPSSGALDNYFHPVSLDQIRTYNNSVACGDDSPTGNTPPTCEGNPDGYSLFVPPGTPFELNAIGFDGNLGDVLTYAFEPYDEDGSFIFTQGKIGAAAAIDASAPLFRSVPPSSIPSRVFPDLESILAGNNNNDDFEVLSQVSRNMDFVLVVRDNNPNGGGICTTPITVGVNDFLFQFDLDSQNSPETWAADGTNTATIEWGLSDTFLNYDCEDGYDIFFSVDGGQTFPYLLAEAPVYDPITDDPLGSFEITVPNLPTTEGRVKVGCKNQIWFDINDADITITNSTCDANGGFISPDEDVIAAQGDVSLDLSLTNSFGSTSPSFSGALESTDEAATLASDNAGTCETSGNPIVFDEYFFQVDMTGNYTFAFDTPNNNRIINVYNQPMNPADECEGWLGSSADFVVGGINPSDDVTLNLDAGNDYYLVVSSFNASLPSLPAAYQVNASGPGTVFSGTIPPPAAFSYGYVTVNCATNIIEDFNLNPDLTAYDGGTYKVYGLSYPTGAGAGYVGGTFNALVNDIVDLSLCASLSSNSVLVTINGPLCDLATEDDDNDGVCNQFDACPGFDDNLDSDGDGIPDCLDPCFGSSNFDFDGDGFCSGYDCIDSSDESDFPSSNGDGIITLNESDNNGNNIPDDCEDNCHITDVIWGEPGSCNNNGTIANAYDDFYLVDITVQFYNPFLTGELEITQTIPSEDFSAGTDIIASVDASTLVGLSSYTFVDVPVYLYFSSNFLNVNFTDDTFSDFCSIGVVSPFDVEECSCQEIMVEITSIECVDVDGTPYDTSDDEIQYTYIATKGTGGMGSSTEGQYGVVEDCFGDDEGTSGDCDPISQEGTFGEEETVTTSTNAANGGGPRRFTITYDDGCEQDFEFPPFEGDCCIPPMFTAELICTNPNNGMEAGFDEFYVAVTTTDTGTETGDVQVNIGAQTALISGGLGTAYLGPFNFNDGTTAGTITLGVIDQCTVSAEFIEQFCGYTVNAPGGDNLTNDLHENGYFCIEQNGFTEPSIIAQHPGGPTEPTDIIDFAYVYVLTDAAGNILELNNSGLFTDLMDLTQYTVYVDSVKTENLGEINVLFPIGSPFDLALCVDCYSLTLDILCDQCPLDPEKEEPGICGCGNPDPGAPCDDGIPFSINDVILADCSCEGEYIPSIEILDPCVCLNNASDQTDGQFSELIQIQSGPGEIWSLTFVNAIYLPSSMAPPITPTLFSVGDVFESGLSDGIDNDNDGSIDEADEHFYYTLEGIHVDDLGYSIEVSNGSSDLFIYNKCYYPVFNISSVVPFEYLPLDISTIVLNGQSHQPAIGSGTYNLYDSAGNLIQSDITEIPDGLIIGNEYMLELSFDENEILPITLPGGSSTPGCLQEQTILFKVLSLGCSNN